MMSLLDIAISLLAAAGAIYPGSGIRGGYNIGWGTGFLPFVLIGVPALAFVLWFEVNRRNRKR